MLIPNWWTAALLCLAAFRTWKLLGDDTILDWPRDRSMELAYKIGGPKLKNYWDALLSCPWCSGAWLSLLWWGAFQLWPNGTTIAAVPFAISAVVGLLGHLISD